MSYGKVLVPVSGKTGGERALKMLEHAKRLVKDEIIIMHAYAPLPSLIGGQSHQSLIKEAYDESMALLAPIIATLQQEETPYKVVILEGYPAGAILHVAMEEECDLIIMYTDGRDSFEDFLLGTITEHVLRNTSKHLLAIRT